MRVAWVEYFRGADKAWRLRHLRMTATALLILVIVYFSVTLGWAARRWVWDVTDPVRFIPDTRRQCYWAVESSGSEGMLNQYEKMAIQTRQWEPWLDYVPLRLLVMRQWGRYLRRHDPAVATRGYEQAYERPYEFSAPLLKFNATMDGIAAVAAFFLTRLWVRRSAIESNDFNSGLWQGVTAGLFIWFSPAILLSAYAWPTWDSWIAPLYLSAALAASLDWWFCAGIAVAIGAMLKGQQLAVAPIFVVWPLVQGRFGAAARWSIGLTAGIAVIASPWLLTSIPADRLAAARMVQQGTTPEQYPSTLFAIPRALNMTALLWILGAVVAMAALPRINLTRLKIRPKFGPAIRGLIVCSLILWPWLIPRNASDWLIAIGVATACLWTVYFLPRRYQFYSVAAVAGGSLLLSMRLFNTSHAWWDCGFGFGSSRWHWIASSLTDNLPGLLFERFGWSKDPDATAFVLSAVGGHWPAFFSSHGWWPACTIAVSSKQLFNPMFLLLLLICAIGLGRVAGRKDRRTLAALTTPWLLFFLIPVEIHGRYALFPATVSAICMGESLGTALLSVFLMLAATVQILDALLQGGNRFGLQMLLSNRYPKWIAPNFVQTLYRALEHTHPDLAWANFIAGGVFIYLTFARSGGMIGRQKSV